MIVGVATERIRLEGPGRITSCIVRRFPDILEGLLLQSLRLRDLAIAVCVFCRHWIAARVHGVALLVRDPELFRVLCRRVGLADPVVACGSVVALTTHVRFALCDWCSRLNGSGGCRKRDAVVALRESDRSDRLVRLRLSLFFLFTARWEGVNI